MSNYDFIKNSVYKFRELIFQTEKYIWQNPETGFKEKKTSAYMEKVFCDFGYDIVKAQNIPGFYTVVDTGRPGPQILVLAEMDSLLCENHPASDKKTGAAHACGHHTQCAAMVGIAGALKDENVLKQLCGKIRLAVVPAEELLEIDYRASLKEQGVIRYFGGKTEFLYRGYFDGCDIALMVHAGNKSEFYVNVANVGCIAKNITFKGKSTHAGTPEKCINALYAANQGLNAINALRETFADNDVVRVHPIITSGGAAVNAIPDKVMVESYVRSASFEALSDVNNRVNRALCGAALSLGANVDIYDIPGYAPLTNSVGLIDVAKEALARVFPTEQLVNTGIVSGGCTDMGDLSMLMPAIHPYAPGANGALHSVDFKVTDVESVCVNSAIWQIAMIDVLLSDNGERAMKIKREYVPKFSSKQEYLNYLDSVFSSGDRITYSDSEAVVKL